jgi:O-antigen/teichoic acid export membrane protein
MQFIKSNFLRSAAGTVVMQGTSAVLMLVLGLVLARTLGETNFGAYEYTETWVEVLMLFGMLGFDRLLIRQVAVFESSDAYGNLWGLLRYAWRRILISSVILAVSMVLAVSTFFLFVDQSPRDNSHLLLVTFTLGMLIVPVRTLLKFNQGTLQGLQRTALAYLADFVLRPALLLLFIWLLVDTAPEAIIAHLIASVVALLVSGSLVMYFLPGREVSPTNDTRWVKFTWPFMVISGFNLLNIRGGSIIVGLVSDLETVALYGVAVRVAWVVVLMLTATSAVAAPRIARLYQAGDMQSLQQFISTSTRFIALLTLPVAGLLIIFGDHILMLFGPGFVDAHGALVVLCMGQIVNAATGFVGWIMMMTGNERRMMRVLMVTVGVHMVLLTGLTPLLGATGAALATAFVNALTNIWLTIVVYRRIGLNASLF